MVINRIGPDRIGDILQFLKSQIVEDNVDFAADLPVRIVGDANAAGLCNAFKARCDVDAVAEDIIVIDNDVADMNPDRNSIFRSAGTPAFCAVIPRWTWIAQRTASTALANSTSRPSPVVLTMRPR